VLFEKSHEKNRYCILQNAFPARHVCSPASSSKRARVRGLLSRWTKWRPAARSSQYDDEIQRERSTKSRWRRISFRGIKALPLHLPKQCCDETLPTIWTPEGKCGVTRSCRVYRHFGIHETPPSDDAKGLDEKVAGSVFASVQ